jgi:PST family polysaccharide transporter
LLLGVVFALSGAGYWALVAQLIGQSATALGGVVLMARWWPGRPRRGAEIGQFLHFGKNLALSSVVYYIANNLDTLTIAVRLGPAPLGIYNRAFSLLMSPLNQLRSPATTVALPVLSKLQDDHSTAGEYLKRGQLAFGYSIVAGLSICAGSAVPVVHLVLGPRWAAAAPVLAFLSVAGACTMLSYVGFWVYLSRGLGKQLLRYTLATLVLQAVCVVGGSRWGVNGVAAGYMVAALVEWPASLCWLSRLTYLPLRDLLHGAVRVTLCGAVAGACAWLVTHLTADPATDLNAAAGVAGGIAANAIAGLAFRRVRVDLRLVAAIGRRMMRR